MNVNIHHERTRTSAPHEPSTQERQFLIDLLRDLPKDEQHDDTGSMQNALSSSSTRGDRDDEEQQEERQHNSDNREVDRGRRRRGQQEGSEEWCHQAMTPPNDVVLPLFSSPTLALAEFPSSGDNTVLSSALSSRPAAAVVTSSIEKTLSSSFSSSAATVTPTNARAPSALLSSRKARVVHGLRRDYDVNNNFTNATNKHSHMNGEHVRPKGEVRPQGNSSGQQQIRPLYEDDREMSRNTRRLSSTTMRRGASAKRQQRNDEDDDDTGNDDDDERQRPSPPMTLVRAVTPLLFSSNASAICCAIALILLYYFPPVQKLTAAFILVMLYIIFCPKPRKNDEVWERHKDPISSRMLSVQLAQSELLKPLFERNARVLLLSRPTASTRGAAPLSASGSTSFSPTQVSSSPVSSLLHRDPHRRSSHNATRGGSRRDRDEKEKEKAEKRDTKSLSSPSPPSSLSSSVRTEDSNYSSSDSDGLDGFSPFGPEDDETVIKPLIILSYHVRRERTKTKMEKAPQKGGEEQGREQAGAGKSNERRTSTPNSTRGDEIAEQPCDLSTSKGKEGGEDIKVEEEEAKGRQEEISSSSNSMRSPPRRARGLGLFADDDDDVNNDSDNRNTTTTTTTTNNNNNNNNNNNIEANSMIERKREESSLRLFLLPAKERSKVEELQRTKPKCRGENDKFSPLLRLYARCSRTISSVFRKVRIFSRHIMSFLNGCRSAARLIFPLLVCVSSILTSREGRLWLLYGSIPIPPRTLRRALLAFIGRTVNGFLDLAMFLLLRANLEAPEFIDHALLYADVFVNYTHKGGGSSSSSNTTKRGGIGGDVGGGGYGRRKRRSSRHSRHSMRSRSPSTYSSRSSASESMKAVRTMSGPRCTSRSRRSPSGPSGSSPHLHRCFCYCGHFAADPIVDCGSAVDNNALLLLAGDLSQSEEGLAVGGNNRRRGERRALSPPEFSHVCGEGIGIIEEDKGKGEGARKEVEFVPSPPRAAKLRSRSQSGNGEDFLTPTHSAMFSRAISPHTILGRSAPLQPLLRVTSLSRHVATTTASPSVSPSEESRNGTRFISKHNNNSNSAYTASHSLPSLFQTMCFVADESQALSFSLPLPRFVLCGIGGLMMYSRAPLVRVLHLFQKKGKKVREERGAARGGRAGGAAQGVSSPESPTGLPTRGGGNRGERGSSMRSLPSSPAEEASLRARARESRRRDATKRSRGVEGARGGGGGGGGGGSGGPVSSITASRESNAAAGSTAVASEGVSSSAPPNTTRHLLSSPSHSLHSHRHHSPFRYFPSVPSSVVGTPKKTAASSPSSSRHHMPLQIRNHHQINRNQDDSDRIFAISNNNRTCPKCLMPIRSGDDTTNHNGRGVFEGEEENGNGVGLAGGGALPSSWSLFRSSSRRSSVSRAHSFASDTCASNNDQFEAKMEGGGGFFFDDNGRDDFGSAEEVSSHDNANDYEDGDYNSLHATEFVEMAKSTPTVVILHKPIVIPREEWESARKAAAAAATTTDSSSISIASAVGTDPTAYSTLTAVSSSSLLSGQSSLSSSSFHHSSSSFSKGFLSRHFASSRVTEAKGVFSAAMKCGASIVPVVIFDEDEDEGEVDKETKDSHARDKNKEDINNMESTPTGRNGATKNAEGERDQLPQYNNESHLLPELTPATTTRRRHRHMPSSVRVGAPVFTAPIDVPRPEDVRRVTAVTADSLHALLQTLV